MERERERDALLRLFCFLVLAIAKGYQSLRAASPRHLDKLCSPHSKYNSILTHSMPHGKMHTPFLLVALIHESWNTYHAGQAYNVEDEEIKFILASQRTLGVESFCDM